MERQIRGDLWMYLNWTFSQQCGKEEKMIRWIQIIDGLNLRGTAKQTNKKDKKIMEFLRNLTM